MLPLIHEIHLICITNQICITIVFVRYKKHSELLNKEKTLPTKRQRGVYKLNNLKINNFN
jgi:hypothetical protein